MENEAVLLDIIKLMMLFIQLEVGAKQSSKKKKSTEAKACKGMFRLTVEVL